MAFRKKWNPLVKLPADLLVISECESESKFVGAQRVPGLQDFLWVGTNENKGIGILSFNNYRIEICSFYNPEFKYVVPVNAQKGEEGFLVFAIWAMPHETSKTKGYVGQVWRSINYYSDKLNNRTILTGDFNSNSIWDKMRKVGNHSDVENFLAARNIFSLYHKQTRELSGEESSATFFLHRKKEKPYHIDYCFLSEELINAQTKIKVGDFEDWIELSDHVPIMIENIGH